MRSEFDFSPLFRSTVGFDRMLDLLQRATRLEGADGFPPYDIEQTGEDRYRVTLAVAGFSPEELTVTAEQNVLLVSGERRQGEASEAQPRHFLHRGIAGRAFQRRFELADHVRVEGANLSNGLLTIELKREVPEAMRPRRIPIGRAESKPAPQIEQPREAA